MEVLLGLRITFWLERLSLPLSSMGQGREPASPPKTGLPEPGRGPGQSTVSWETGSLPPLQWHTMAAFSPVTFPQPELYTAVSSPSPKGPGMGGISPALEKDPRSFYPVLGPFLFPKFTSPQGVGRMVPRALAHWGLSSGKRLGDSNGSRHGMVSGCVSQQSHSLAA